MYLICDTGRLLIGVGSGGGGGSGVALNYNRMSIQGSA